MDVKDIMIEGVDTISENETLEDALKRMTEEGESGSLIVEKDGEVIGIITTWDIMETIGRKRDLNDVNVSEVMETHIVTIHTNAPIEEAAKEMVDHGIWRLPVEDSGQIVGIVSATDILVDKVRNVI